MKPKRKRAESLIETIVAITVIALGATATGVMVRTSILGNELSQDRMTALNLAKEGIEAVRNIRDTNWLRYELNQDACWNTLQEPGVDITNCDLNPIDEDYYELKLNLSNSYFEYMLADTGDDDVFFDDYLLYECIIEDVDLEAGTLYANPTGAPEAYDCEETVFYRMIYIDYETDLPTDDLMTVTSTVGWTTDGEQRSVSLMESIGNW